MSFLLIPNGSGESSVPFTGQKIRIRVLVSKAE